MWWTLTFYGEALNRIPMRSFIVNPVCPTHVDQTGLTLLQSIKSSYLQLKWFRLSIGVFHSLASRAAYFAMSLWPPSHVRVHIKSALRTVVITYPTARSFCYSFSNHPETLLSSFRERLINIQTASSWSLVSSFVVTINAIFLYRKEGKGC